MVVKRCKNSTRYVESSCTEIYLHAWKNYHGFGGTPPVLPPYGSALVKCCTVRPFSFMSVGQLQQVMWRDVTHTWTEWQERRPTDWRWVDGRCRPGLSQHAGWPAGDRTDGVDWQSKSHSPETRQRLGPVIDYRRTNPHDGAHYAWPHQTALYAFTAQWLSLRALNFHIIGLNQAWPILISRSHANESFSA